MPLVTKLNGFRCSVLMDCQDTNGLRLFVSATTSTSTRRKIVAVPFQDENPIYTPTEVLSMLDISSRALLSWCLKGKVPGAFQTLGGHWRIPESGVKELLLTMGFSQNDVDSACEQFKDFQFEQQVGGPIGVEYLRKQEE